MSARSGVALALASASVGAGAAAALEAGWAGGGTSVFLAALGPWLLWAPILAVAVAGARPVGDRLRWAWAAPESRGALLAGLLLWALSLAAVALAVRLSLPLLVARLHNPRLLGPAAAVLVTALLVGLSALVVGLRGPLAALLARLPALPAGLSVFAVAAAALVDTAARPVAALAKDLSARPAALIAVALAVALLTAHLARRWPRWAAPLALGGLVAAVLGVRAYSTDAPARVRLDAARGLSPLVAQVAWALSDADGDGYGRWLGGGDCDDEAPEIFPGARDVPGNGVDEDCLGGDRAAIEVVGERPRVPRAPLPKSLRRRWNVLVLTVDALRPDHLPWGGYGRDTAPHLNALTAHGLVFERAYAPCTDTRYSVPPLFAGRPLPDMGLDWAGRYLIVPPTEAPMLLFDRLHRVGYATAAYTAEQLTDGMWYGLEAGVEDYVGRPDVTLRGRSSERLTDLALERLAAWRSEAGGRPWALWLHYLAPHEPYLAHRAHDFGAAPVDRYDGEIAATDAQIGRLWEALTRAGQAAHTLLILTADHGEEFGEHGRRFHGKQLFDESVRVPLLIHVPGAPAVRVPEAISTLDMAETVADLVGVQAGLDFGARSHAPRLVGGPAPAARPVFVLRVHNERPVLRELALIEGHHKLIYDVAKRVGRLYDLGADPGERVDLRARDADRFAALMTQARAEVDRFKDALYTSLRARHVSAEIPAHLVGRRPRQVASNLDLLGAEARTVSFGGRELQEVRAWLRPRGVVPSDVRLSVRWLDAAGAPGKALRADPLGGLYPPAAWTAGEVIELLSWERVPAAQARSAELIVRRRSEAPRVIPVARVR